MKLVIYRFTLRKGHSTDCPGLQTKVYCTFSFITLLTLARASHNLKTKTFFYQPASKNASLPFNILSKFLISGSQHGHLNG